MSESSQHTVILGAGPAGMATAMELSRANKSSVLIEKAKQVGGLAKTLEFNEPDGLYRTDIGPHRFYSKNQYLYDFIEDLLHEEWRKVPRCTRFFVDGKYYFYPIRMSDTLIKMGIVKAFRVLFDYAWERLRAVVYPRTINSFEDYVIANFGRTLARFNMLNYTEKIWGIPCTNISADWAQQRIGGLSVFQTLKKAIFKKSSAKSLVDSFYYPQYGTGTIYEAIAKRITEEGSTVQTQSMPTKIHHDGKRITSVDIENNGKSESMDIEHLVSSIPLTECVKLFSPSAPTEVLEAAAGMRFRSQRYLFLTINKESVSKDNWLYYPDLDIPFGRLSEMKNFSTDMCPKGKTSLMVEYFCFKDDEIWSMPKQELLDLTVEWFEKINLLKEEDIQNVHEHRIEHVYPIYDLKYQERLNTVMDWMNQFENLYLIGRPGRFRYNNQDHSLEMGILAARSIIDNKRYNIEDVGAEKEYFEQGFVPSKK